MSQEERLLLILQYLTDHNRITVEDICTYYDVSRDTARRDLVKLEEQQKIIRTRGGAILPSNHKRVHNYHHRLQYVSEEKKKIGKLAATLIQDNDHIILDTSTTVQAMGEYIDLECTVITNSIHVAEILSDKTNPNIHLLGGILHKEHRYLYGHSVLEKLDYFTVDKVFIGIVGISENGLTIVDEEDGAVKRKMMQRAKQVIVLADHSKIGITEFFQFAKLEEIDLVITDEEPNQAFIQLLTENNVELLVANSNKVGQ
ncbi:DeoR/GlpR family DNA-binding transcription regulator [Niallia sp. 03133]|uniref:DeoR/GlpR family DNA-binding transcription regulator n=1 Tax=Niallia sp. 03133 TaxID=3458060 RepID=UPI004044379E